MKVFCILQLVFRENGKITKINALKYRLRGLQFHICLEESSSPNFSDNLEQPLGKKCPRTFRSEVPSDIYGRCARRHLRAQCSRTLRGTVPIDAIAIGNLGRSRPRRVRLGLKQIEIFFSTIGYTLCSTKNCGNCGVGCESLN